MHLFDSLQIQITSYVKLCICVSVHVNETSESNERI